MKKIDLQMHTTASDGGFSPKEVIDLAIRKGMKAIAITDHDTVSGLGEAIDYSRGKGLEVVPGVELSCHETIYSKTIDVLGLFINYESSEMKSFLKRDQENRIWEKKEIIKKLNDLGYSISFEELLEESGESLGRPIIAKILVRKYSEKFSNVGDVFDKLIVEGKPAFVPRPKTSLKQAIEVIKNSGGVSILAHPGKYGSSLEEIVVIFSKAGGDGIECDYPYSKILGLDDSVNTKLRKIAGGKNLLVSGGSDFHDLERSSLIGDGGVSEDEFYILKERARLRKF